MFKIFGGERFCFTQWDVDQKLIVEGDYEVVHMNNGTGTAQVLGVHEFEGCRVVDVPNIYLQKSGRFTVYAYVVDETSGAYTEHTQTFHIVPKPKPDDYAYTETEVLTFSTLLAKAKESGEFDGDTPYIGENLHWWIGDVDTGVVAGYPADGNEVMAQSDWLAAEGEPGHVKNRTHWTEVCLTDTLTFDGDILGKQAIEIDGTYFVRVGDYVERAAVIGSTVTTVALAEDFPSGTETLTEDMVADLTEYAGVESWQYGTFVNAVRYEVTMEGITFPAGIWFLYIPGFGYTSELKAPSAIFGSGVIHKLDPKYLPDGLPYTEGGGLVEIPVSGSWVLEDDEYYMFVMTAPVGLELGKTYTVNWNGTDYQVVGQDASVISGGELAGVYLGNAATGGGEDTGEPFAILELATAMNGMYGMAISVDNTVAQFTIYGESEIIHKLDNKFIDAEWIATTKEKALLEQQEFHFEVDHNEVEIGSTKDLPLEPDKTYIVYWNGVRYELPVVSIDMGEMIVYVLGDESTLGFSIVWGHIIGSIHPSSIKATAVGMGGQTVAIGISEYAPDPIPEEYLPESVDGVVIRSSTEGSEKKFKLTVDDSGTITATEV